MDVSKKLVDHMRKKGVEGYMDINKVPKQIFEIVTAFDVIEHTTSPTQLVKQMQRVLKKNGLIMKLHQTSLAYQEKY